MKAWPWIVGGLVFTLSLRRRLPAPLDRVSITSPFGPRLVNGTLQDHNGVDLYAAIGTPVKAVSKGVATWGYNDRSGNWILIEDGPYVYGYAHLSSIEVLQGQQVRQGDRIGATGATGNTRGAHLHFTVRVNGETVDPVQYVRLT